MPVIHRDHFACKIIHHHPIAFPTLKSGASLIDVVYRACPPGMISARVSAVESQDEGNLVL
jgi:hypothetical protein